jgi:hypothetical protein
MVLLVFVLNEMALVLEGLYWNGVDIRAQISGAAYLKRDRHESIKAFRVRIRIPR